MQCPSLCKILACLSCRVPLPYWYYLSYSGDTMRINARLEDSYELKFRVIQQRERKNLTDILKEALDEYFARRLQQDEQAAWQNNQRILQMLAGIGAGAEDLSSNYKAYLQQGLAEKHDLN